MAHDTVRVPDDRRWLALFTLVLLLAAFLRLWAFGDAPPGLQHDEMFKALEGRRLADVGDFRVFYPSNQGHEGGYVWALGLSMALLGTNVLAVKFPAFIFGMLTVALTIRLGGKLVSRRAAFFAGGLCAVTFFALFTSRVGLRAVMLPVFVIWFTLALDALLRRPTPRAVNFWRRLWSPAVSAGFALGLAIYTYTSAFALWGGLAALVVVLAVLDRKKLRAVWRNLMLTAAVGLVLSLPMLAARFTNPEGFNRSSSISRPLNDALAGRPQELLENAVGLLGMAAFTGDPEARYNIPNRPYFPLPVGLLAYIGLAILIYRLRQKPIFAVLLGIAAAGLVPSLLTVSAPSFLRSIALLPILMLCVSVGIDRMPGRAGWVGGLVVLSLIGVMDTRAYFIEWARMPELQAIYRDDLEQLARAVADSDGEWFVSTPDPELDSMTFSIYAGEDAARVSFFDGDTTVAFAGGARLAISPLAPLTPPHQAFASAAYGAESQPNIMSQIGLRAFAVYDMALTGTAEARIVGAGSAGAFLWPDNDFPSGALPSWANPAAYPVNFGGVVALDGVELADRVVARAQDGVNLQLFLRPLISHVEPPLSVFVHVYRQGNGRLHAQRDLLGAPSREWLSGSTIVQDNFVIMGDSRPGWYIVALGVYDIASGERLPVLAADGSVSGDRIIIGRVQVGE